MGQSVNIVVEDALSNSVIRVLLARASGHPKIAYSYPITKGWQVGGGPNGYGYIKSSLIGFNLAAATIPFVVLIDADNRPCPPQTIADWLNNNLKHPNLIVRIAVREVESWLIADRSGISSFLAVPENLVPVNPEALGDPKLCIVQLAAQSRHKDIRGDIAPAPGTQAETGPNYTRSLAAFASNFWDVDAASLESDSLRRAVLALEAL